VRGISARRWPRPGGRRGGVGRLSRSGSPSSAPWSHRSSCRCSPAPHRARSAWWSGPDCW